jgi:hypothetical protein
MNIGKRKRDIEEAILKYKSLISYRVRGSLGPQNPEWEDLVNDIINHAQDLLRKMIRG